MNILLVTAAISLSFIVSSSAQAKSYEEDQTITVEDQKEYLEDRQKALKKNRSQRAEVKRKTSRARRINTRGHRADARPENTSLNTPYFKSLSPKEQKAFVKEHEQLRSMNPQERNAYKRKKRLEAKNKKRTDNNMQKNIKMPGGKQGALINLHNKTRNLSPAEHRALFKKK